MLKVIRRKDMIKYYDDDYTQTTVNGWLSDPFFLFRDWVDCSVREYDI